MGYRSTIYVKFKDEDKQEFESLLKKHELNDYFEEHDEDDDYSRWIASDLKWYSSYSDVSAINDWVNTEDKERGLIAVGEDSATEHYGDTSELEMYEVVDIQW